MTASVALTGALVGVSALAETATFIETNTTAATALQWMDAKYWTDAEGASLGYAPTNGETIVFRDLPTKGKGINGLRVQTATDGKIATRTQDFSFSCLTGDVRHIIRHSAKLPNENKAADQRLTVTDPNGFLGHWEAGGPHAVISLPGNGTADFVPTLGTLNMKNRPIVEVSADKAAAVTQLDGKGLMEKSGAGSLEITTANGADTGIYQSDGKLSLRGEDGTELQKLLAQSAFHLDATDVDSVVTSNDTETGYSWVMRWNDVRPANTEYYVYGAFGAYSKASHLIPDMRPAFISKTDAPTGKRLVSFGSNIKYYDPVNMGPTNCILRFNKAFTKIREVFYAVETPYGANYNVGILGYSADAYYMWGASEHLFSYGADTDGQRAIAYGEVCVNGEYKPMEDIDATKMKDLFTVGVGLANDAKVNMLGSSRGYRVNSCGSRMGELLFFTNVLTRAQRTRINNYLNAKWRTGAQAGLGTVVATVSSAEISVPAGRTASVQDVVTAKGGELVKTGAGKLTLDEIASTGDVKVRVEGGSIAFAKTLVAPATNAPAANPWLWLDANESGCCDETTSAYFPDTTFVTKWYDCRADKRATSYASCFAEQYNPGTKDITETVARLPTVATWAGKRIFDFGSQYDATLKNRASFKLSNWQTTAADGTYAAFAVIRPLTTTSYEPIFGSYNYSEGVPRNQRLFANPTWSQGHALAARWAVDGVKCDPTVEQPCLNQTEDFFVLSVSGGQPFTFESIFQDRNPSSNDDFAYSTTAGQFQIGEVLSYYRPLTEKEVRETEAYLMNKWLGKTHPAAQAVQIDKLTFADGVTPNVEVGEGVEVKVSSFESPSGTITKTGAGKLTFTVPEDLSCTNFPSVTVEGGTLQFDYAGEWASEKVIWAHMDANNERKITTREVDDAELGHITIVDEMFDVDGRVAWAGNKWNTMRLAVAGNGKTTTKTNGVLTAVNPGGGDLKMVTIIGPATATETGTGVLSHRNSRNNVNFNWWFGNQSSQQPSYPTDVFMIWDDRRDLRRQYGIDETIDPVDFTSCNGYTKSVWYRGANFNLAHPTKSNASIREGYLSIDGVEATSASQVPEGVHLITASMKEPVKFSGTIGQRVTSWGAVNSALFALGEIIYYTNKLDRTTHKYIAAKLMKKWFGKNMATNVAEVGALALANGGTFALKNDQSADGDGFVLSCASLSGDGTVDVDELDGLANIAVSFQNRQTTNLLTVSGTAKLAASGTITIAVPAGVDVKPGEYTLFEADRLIGSLDGWNVDFDGAIKRNCRVVIDGNAIKLRVSATGMIILVR